MNLQQIKYFLALSSELHFWKAAEKMNITQSAFSRQIKALEDELGVVLFERNKRSVKLTESGSFLKERWATMLDEIDRTHRQAKKIHDGVFGFISIGYPGSVAYGFLPELLENIVEAIPELRIELVEPTDISYENLLLNYQMDLAFSRDKINNPLLQSECLYSESISLVVPDSHWLNEENFRGLEDVKGEKFILSGLHHTTFYASLLRQVFKECGFEPNVHIESDFGAMIVSLVARGLGISILPNAFLSSATPGVRFISLPYKVRLYVIWRKEDSSPILSNVLRQVQQLASKYS